MLYGSKQLYSRDLRSAGQATEDDTLMHFALGAPNSWYASVIRWYRNYEHSFHAGPEARRSHHVKRLANLTSRTTFFMTLPGKGCQSDQNQNSNPSSLWKWDQLVGRCRCSSETHISIGRPSCLI
jgi:hypothetical protein